MDYSCRDIPMRLDVKHQPLNFDIYLSQVIDLPRTSLDEEPYNFQLELDALQKVDQILKRTQKEDAVVNPTDERETTVVEATNSELMGSKPSPDQLLSFNEPPPPSCPTETPLTPIKSTHIPSQTGNTETEPPASSLINPRDFEEMHFDPFDHLALQTIDERRELSLVFQASYANRAATNQLQSTTTDSNANHNTSYKNA